MPDHSLPAHAQVVVIGGGVMGCSTLYHLAEMGVTDTVLLERNKLTSGTTWHSAAQVRALRHSRNLTRMIQYSVDLYARLETETGQSVGWIQKGSLSIATTQDRLTHIRRQEALAKAFGINARSVSPAEAAERWPLMNAGDVIGAVWSPDDGRVSPTDVCAALIKGAKGRGASIFEDTPVTGILTNRGRVVGVEATGHVIRCDAVAICAGLWSRDVAAMAGAKAPLLACEHFYLLTKPVEGICGNMPTLSDHDGHLYIRDDSGGLLVGCFEPMGKPIAPGRLADDFAFGLLPEDWDHFEPMMKNALHRLPSLETAEVKMLLNGPESFTPDGMFMLGETAETRGLYLGCGMNSVGLATGGGAGMNLAHLITKGRTAYDLGEADAKRFAPVFNDVKHLMARAPEILGTHYEIAHPGRQLRTARGLRHGPLARIHAQAGAVTGQFYGWERPLYFGDRPKALTFGRPGWHDAVASEVRSAHEAAALFDLSPFGKIEVEGRDAEAFMSHVCAGFVTRKPGSVIYTPILDERGCFESDVTAQRIAEDHYRVFTGAAAIARDLAWFRRHADGFDVTLTDTSETYAQIALMGPDAARIAAECGAGALAELRYFEVGPSHIAGKHIRAARMSYVGEAGWEITMKAENAAAVVEALCKAGARLAGLYAQTAMRIEKGFRAMGHELDSDVTPVDVGMDWAVAKRRSFIGADALAIRRREGARTNVATLIFSDQNATPLGHEPVYRGDRIIGQTTSAAYGHRIGAPAALAFVECIDDLNDVEVDIAGARHGASLQFDAAFDSAGARMKV
ncbi:MAG: FAD-dependent oxidoreductase [Pseudomonadota bacterium]